MLFANNGWKLFRNFQLILYGQNFFFRTREHFIFKKAFGISYNTRSITRPKELTAYLGNIYKDDLNRDFINKYCSLMLQNNITYKVYILVK